MPTMRRDERLHDGVHYPVSHLAAALRDIGEAEQAALALHDAGFTDVVVFDGLEGLRVIEANEHKANPLMRVWERLSIRLSDDADARQELLESLRQGHAWVMVYASDGVHVDQAHGILKAYQAHGIRFFGRWTITELAR